jgi:hypothetical protein
MKGRHHCEFQYLRCARSPDQVREPPALPAFLKQHQSGLCTPDKNHWL